MGFQSPLLLLALLLLPLAVLAYCGSRAAGAERPGRVRRRAACCRRSPRGGRAGGGTRRCSLYALALAGLAVALARPEITVAVPDERASIILATDSSGSMQATDVRAVAARRRARARACGFLDDVPDEVRVGAVVFNHAVRSMEPPSTDRAAVRAALERLRPSGGTATGEALAGAARNGRAQRGGAPRPAAIVLLSDGASTHGREPLPLADAAARRQIPIYTVALGTDAGTIEVDTPSGTRQRAVPPDRDTLRRLAASSGGRYFEADDQPELSEVYERLGSQVGKRDEQREMTAAFAGGGRAAAARGRRAVAALVPPASLIPPVHLRVAGYEDGVARTPMKWWGWGAEDVAFSHEGRPELGPFIERHLALDVRRAGTRPPAFEELDVPEPVLPARLAGRLERVVGAEHVSTDGLDRVVHGRGKSLTDLVRQRRGDLGRLPDVVVRPGGEGEVAGLVQAALDEDAVAIPFGGGSSISGSLEAEPDERRSVISVDMGRLNQVLWVDATSQLACVQAGAFGPDLERQLNARGWTCGHFPDSFTHSTLGGWIATRSSGMQSDRYGDIAELTRGLRVVTPSGTLIVRPVPSTSTGPSVREMVLGSEGRLGVITEATIHVRRVPPERKILGYLFPTWPAALRAMRDIAASEASPSVTRVSDAPETAFSFAMRDTPTLLDRVKSRALQTFLKRKGWDLEAMCLSLIGYEGSAQHVARQRNLTERIVKRHGGLGIGASPGSCTTRRSSTPPTSATSCSTAARRPTSRRRQRPGADFRPSTTTSWRPAATPSGGWACPAT